MGSLQDLVTLGYLIFLMILGTLADVGPFQGLKDLIALDLWGSTGDSDPFEKVSSLQALEAFGN